MSQLNRYGLTEREMEYLSPDPIRKMNRDAKIHWNIRLWGFVIFAVLMTAVFIRWTEWHTKHAQAAYESYENCVENTYGVSATKFYQVYGEPANCN